ncbi:hypothetical protein FB451DRAFT_1492438 [Mycena latifolia]|nr:hypothetical protein FB451DRAFT_1492438 [Mycena latifolia]
MPRPCAKRMKERKRRTTHPIAIAHVHRRSPRPPPAIDTPVRLLRVERALQLGEPRALLVRGEVYDVLCVVPAPACTTPARSGGQREETRTLRARSGRGGTGRGSSCRTAGSSTPCRVVPAAEVQRERARGRKSPLRRRAGGCRPARRGRPRRGRRRRARRGAHPALHRPLVVLVRPVAVLARPETYARYTFIRLPPTPLISTRNDKEKKQRGLHLVKAVVPSEHTHLIREPDGAAGGAARRRAAGAWRTSAGRRPCARAVVGGVVVVRRAQAWGGAHDGAEHEEEEHARSVGAMLAVRRRGGEGDDVDGDGEEESGQRVKCDCERGKKGREGSSESRFELDAWSNTLPYITFHDSLSPLRHSGPSCHRAGPRRTSPRRIHTVVNLGTLRQPLGYGIVRGINRVWIGAGTN